MFMFSVDIFYDCFGSLNVGKSCSETETVDLTLRLTALLDVQQSNGPEFD